MSELKDNWLHDLFISQAKPAQEYHSGLGNSFVDPNDPTIILVDESGNQVTAVLVDEETVFDATANDIREGKVAATEDGVTVGTKEIPAYITTEGVSIVTAGKEYSIELKSDVCDYTKLQALVCAYNTSLSNSVATEKVIINESMYPVNSTELLATAVVDVENGKITFGATNESNKPCVIRFITFKEE